MARDVELVIRAKNEATKAIDSVKDALKELAGAQQEITADAGKTGSALGKLGDELRKLAAESKAIESFGKISQTISTAAGGVDRLKAQVDKTTASLKDLNRASEESKTKTAALKQQTGELTAKLREQEAATKAAKKAQTAANAELRRQEAILANIEKRITIAAKPNETLLKKAEEQKAVVAATKDAQAAAVANFLEQKNAQDQVRNSLKALNAELSVAADAERKVAAGIQATETTLKKQTAELQKAETGFREIKDLASQAKTSLGSLAQSQDAVAAATARNKAQTQQYLAVLERQKRIDAQSDGLQSLAPGKTLATYKAQVEEQVAAVKAAKAAFEEARAEATRLGAEISRAGVPTKQMAEAFNLAKIAAAQAKQEFNNQAQALQRVRTLGASTFKEFSASVQTNKVAVQQNKTSFDSYLQTLIRAANVSRTFNGEVRNTGNAMRTAATGSNSLRTALQGIYGDSRQALSLMQRLRGEVLSLTASYLGLQAAVGGIGKTVSAFNALEAAQNRLGSVFGGDSQRVNQEIEFLRAQAARLGIEFGVLSDQYAKFAISAKSANFTNEATREIFISVAEAARVSKLSIEDIEGSFRALQQMVAKGKVSAEELSGQLGDRMPAAVASFAAALGYATDDLGAFYKDVADGDVRATQENLLAFANELSKRFGPQLESSLRSTSAELGKFQNTLFETATRVANGGFIESFTNLIKQLNESFNSEEGVRFFTQLGAALGKITDVISIVVENFRTLKLVLIAVVAAKATSFFNGLVDSFRNSAAEARKAAIETAALGGQQTSLAAKTSALLAQMRGLYVAYNLAATSAGSLGTASALAGARFVAMSATVGALRGTVSLLAIGFRGLLGALGGIPGIILTGLGFALTSWLTQVEDTTGALEEHKRIMGEVIQAYEKVKTTTGEWAKELKNVSLSQLDKNVIQLRESLQQVRDEVSGIATTDFFTASGLQRSNPAQFELAKQLRDTKKLFDENSISAQEFEKRVQALYGNITDSGLREFGIALLEAAKKAAEVEIALGKSAAAAKEAGSTLQDLDKDAAKVGGTLENALKAGAEDAAQSIDSKLKKSATDFNAILQEMGKSIPAVAEELKRLGEIQALKKLYEDAAKLATTMGQVLALNKQFADSLAAINGKYDAQSLSGTAIEQSMQLIKQKEGFIPTAKFDVNAFRVGYGSDTVTLADGSVQKVVEGMTTTLADANRDLIRRIGEFQTTIKNEIGADRFASFSESQQAVLTSLAYNYGNLTRTGIVDTIRTGTVEEIANAIRSLATQNNGVNADRRMSEAAIFQNGASTNAVTAQQYELETKRAEKAKEYNDDLNERLRLQGIELANGGQLTKEAFVQKAVNDEIARAKAAGVTLDDSRIAKIKELAAAEYELKANTAGTKTELQQANIALQQANALAAQRAAILARLKTTSDPAQQTQLQTQLAGVNSQLEQAIAKATQMWQAIGGPQADVALAKLETLKIKTAAASNQMSYFGLNSSQISSLVNSFADGLVGVFDQFAMAVANGENAMKALGRAFLQFAANFLREIATMILKQAILNALSGLGGPIGTAAGNLAAGTAHTGGVVGAGLSGVGNSRRSVSPAAFAGALRYHNGGIAGLKPNEVPTILKKNEEVLTENDPRHRDNGGMAGGSKQPQTIRNIVTLDPDFARSMLTSSHGERAIMAIVKKNASTVKQMVK